MAIRQNGVQASKEASQDGMLQKNKWKIKYVQAMCTAHLKENQPERELIG